MVPLQRDTVFDLTGVNKGCSVSHINLYLPGVQLILIKAIFALLCNTGQRVHVYSHIYTLGKLGNDISNDRNTKEICECDPSSMER